MSCPTVHLSPSRSATIEAGAVATLTFRPESGDAYEFARFFVDGTDASVLAVEEVRVNEREYLWSGIAIPAALLARFFKYRKLLRPIVILPAQSVTIKVRNNSASAQRVIVTLPGRKLNPATVSRGSVEQPQFMVGAVTLADGASATIAPTPPSEDVRVPRYLLLNTAGAGLATVRVGNDTVRDEAYISQVESELATISLPEPIELRARERLYVDVENVAGGSGDLAFFAEVIPTRLASAPAQGFDTPTPAPAPSQQFGTRTSAPAQGFEASGAGGSPPAEPPMGPDQGFGTRRSSFLT